MTVQDVMDRLTIELNCSISRPKFYHYERKGMFGKIDRDNRGYRIINEKTYQKIKDAYFLSFLKISMKDIKDFVDGKCTDKIVQILKNSRISANYGLKRLNIV